MAWTQDDIDTLKAAIASGARVVKFSSPAGSREIQYSSLAEMLQVLALMEAEVGEAPSTYRRLEMNRGYRTPRPPSARWTDDEWES